MTVIATGVFKTLAFARQTALGTIAGTGTGQLARRVKSTLDLTKNTFKSNEILVSQQRRDLRHGVRAIQGVVSGELSGGTYQNFFESICRQVVQAQVTSGAIATVTAAVTSGASGTFTRSSNSWLTDGFKTGDIVSSTGWATTGVPNNGHYSMITTLTATVMTVTFLDGVAMGPKAAGDSVTFITVGKKTWIPASGQTRDYYTIEHWFGDATLSEVFTDCVCTKVSIKMPPQGMATVDFTFMGLQLTTAGAQYFVSPAAQTTTGIMTAVNGIICVNGNTSAIVTSMNIDINGNYSAPGGIVGANVDPDIFPGVIDVTGTLTILFQTSTQRDLFINEGKFSLFVALSNTTVSNAGFVCFQLPSCKATSATKDDGEKGITLTMNIVSLEPLSGAGAGFNMLDTSFSVQDSAFA